ncbi:hypothetical protein SAMN04490209_5910 [Pseudomonas rhodesiae]|uniref:Uncharacterized protein n=1 Tax=Pseudomonas rhodesiae TaxID=76760 RepID=A0AAE8HJ36_9PSED|nr:hypothetical protein SAMN04490209_5910 [Pseudomonas rhodesiae]
MAVISYGSLDMRSSCQQTRKSQTELPCLCSASDWWRTLAFFSSQAGRPISGVRWRKINEGGSGYAECCLHARNITVPALAFGIPSFAIKVEGCPEINSPIQGGVCPSQGSVDQHRVAIVADLQCFPWIGFKMTLIGRKGLVVSHGCCSDSGCEKTLPALQKNPNPEEDRASSPPLGFVRGYATMEPYQNGDPRDELHPRTGASD